MSDYTCQCCGAGFMAEPDQVELDDDGDATCPPCAQWIEECFIGPTFCDAERALLEKLNDEQAEKYNGCSADIKQQIVTRAIDRGLVKWKIT